MSRKKRKHKPHKIPAGPETLMSTPGNQANTNHKFWSDWAPIEKMTLINVIFVAIYSILTAALCWIASDQYRGMRTDERPWIRVYVDPLPISSAAFTISIHAVNSGKTPAKSFQSEFFIEIVKNGEQPQLNETRPIAGSSTGVMYPNAPGDTPVSYTFTQSEYQDFRDGRVFFVLYSKLTYFDFFRVEHWTRHCQFFDAKPGDYSAKKCTDYNDIDDN